MTKRQSFLLLLVFLLGVLVAVGIIYRYQSRTGEAVEDGSVPIAHAPKEEAQYSVLEVASDVNELEEETDLPQTKQGEDILVDTDLPHEVSDVQLIAQETTNIIQTVESEETQIPNESVPLSKNEVENIALALDLYFKEFNEYPQGGALGIAQALGGENPKRKKFIAFPRINQKGEFLDPWETPYEIALSPDAELEVTSAGPNRVLGDGDDKTLQKKLKRDKK